MKIKIEVVLPSPDYLRTDILNWDKYGASEALSSELPGFDKNIFVPGDGANVAFSLDKNYSWAVKFGYSENYPSIRFYSDGGTALAAVTGTPQLRGAIKNALAQIIATYQPDNTPSVVNNIKPITAGLWILGLVLLFSKLKAAQ